MARFHFIREKKTHYGPPPPAGGKSESLPVIAAILTVAGRTRLLPRPEWHGGRRDGDSRAQARIIYNSNNEATRLGSEVAVVQQRWQRSDFGLAKFSEQLEHASDKCSDFFCCSLRLLATRVENHKSSFLPAYKSCCHPPSSPLHSHQQPF